MSTSPMERTLVAVDELCGFLVACAHVRPDGIRGLTPKSVKKKLRQPSFAAGYRVGRLTRQVPIGRPSDPGRIGPFVPFNGR